MRISDWISDVCSSDLVIVDPDGHATLIDLGAARPRGSAIATTVAGVLGFIPPERSTGPGDHRSDAWALGMTAIYALIGHPQGSMTRADLDDELRGRLAGTPEARRAIGLLSDAIVADPDLRPADLPEWARVLSPTLIPPARRRPRPRAPGRLGADGSR